MDAKSDWFRIAEIGTGAFVIEERYHVQSYLVNGTDRSALIDTGMGFRNIREAIQPLLLQDVIVLNTHWHFDHVGGNALFDKRGISSVERTLVEKGWRNSTLMDLHVESCLSQGIPLPRGFVPEKYDIEGTTPTFDIRDGDRFELGGRTLEAISTPGHTHGSLSFLDTSTRSLFCGDWIDKGTLFAHFEDSDLDEYVGSFQKVAEREREFDSIYPGHGVRPLDRAFLASVREGFDEINAGRLRPALFDEEGCPTQFFRFDEFCVLVKVPGSRGVRLNPFA
jgi:glyoxylase-like metal-dependent hydrolase (beta-lactamase superfamily II)